MDKRRFIFLIGFMAAGKSTIGNLLAQSLGYEYKDTDQIIEERENMSIHKIFLARGEDYFRRLESTVLREITGEPAEKAFVISTGGGMPCSEDNIAHMKRYGTVVYLKATPDDILRRINHSEERPVFHRLKSKGDERKGLEDMLRQRESYYNQASLIFDTTNNTDPHNIAEQIAHTLKEGLGL